MATAPDNFIGERVLCRFFLLSTDLVHATSAGEWLVGRARKRHMAGATLLRGIFGFGSRGIIEPSLWKPVNHVPLIVEIVDTAENVQVFLAETLPELKHGTTTLERAGVLFYRHRHHPTAGVPMNLLGKVKDLSTVPNFAGSHVMSQATFSDAVLLRIFAGDSDRFEGKPLHEAIVRQARAMGLAGATVLHGSTGFGAHSVLHTAKLAELSTDLPIVIELVDSEEKIAAFLNVADGMMQEGMITMEAVRVVKRAARA